MVPVPGPRIEIAELLVLHLVELGEHFDHLPVRIEVDRPTVVAWAKPHRSPDDLDVLATEQVADVVQMRGVAQLERDVMHAAMRPGNEVHRVMVGVAAHENEHVADPVRYPKAE